MTTSSPSGRAIRRILVALDGSPASLEALAIATRLAALLHAELEGMFVEDADLLSFAALPFASLTGAHFGPPQRTQPEEVARSLRLQAQRAKEAMRQTASAVKVDWSFRVVRGNVQREILEAAEQADLLSLGYAGASEPRRARGGSMAHCAARSCACSVLILRRSGTTGSAVVAWVTDDVPGTSVLEAAALAATATLRPLTIVLPADGDRRHVFMEAARTVIGFFDVEVRWLVPQQQGPRAALTEAIRATRNGMLVLHADSELLRQEQVERLLDRAGCSLLIIRRSGAAEAHPPTRTRRPSGAKRPRRLGSDGTL